MNSDFLLELGCEDLPARYVAPLANAFAQSVAFALDVQWNLSRGEVKVYATPRRIAVLVQSVAELQGDQKIERHGPALAAALKDGQPTQAALGFAKSCGVEFSALGQKDGKLHFAKSEPGRKTTDLIPEIFEEALKSMDALVPKRMRWGSGDETFVRPVLWLTCFLGDKIVPLQRFGLEAGNKTYGHRFHAPEAITLKSPAEYETKLKAAKVWVDFESRKAEIKKQIEAEAKKLKGAARITDELLTEVTALVEWPVAIHGRMEERFMALPAEVVIATIETNQRYFPVFGNDGKLLPAFITVSNIESKDFTQVVTGNERVVRPRLTDALFFWELDRKKPLADYAGVLDKVTFQKDLGSTGDKVRRVTKLATHIAGQLSEDKATVERAGSLCKTDLTTRMVFEFPELQGIMGGYYAEAAGESKVIAQAIREHYQPTQAGGEIPSTRAGQIVALADKLDSLSGIFAIGQKPTASKDPFALRRAALGVLRICIEGKLPLDVSALLKSALETQPAGKRDAATLKDLTEFVLERLRAYYETLPAEMYEAVKALGITAPLDFDARIKALNEFWALPAAKNLSAAHKRIRNILKQAGEGDIEIRPDHFHHEEEHKLFESMKQIEGRIQSAAGKSDYAASLNALAQLQKPVDAFFDKVMVMAPEEELRTNRVALLRRLDGLCREVADLSCLPG
ncbi:MAG: glycine--tRNA ligase subunit beta [Pseudomonadota bacterium]